MKFASVLIAGSLLAAAATPASAVVQTFAVWSARAGANVRYVNSGTSAARTTDAIFHSTASSTANTPGAVSVNFSFLQPKLAPFVTNVTALYTLNGQFAKNSPVSASGAFSQSGFSGTFSFISTSAITVSGPGLITTTYAAGSNLLSGSFSGGTLLGTIGGSAGANFATGVNGTTIIYTSDFLNFTPTALLDRSQSLTAVTPIFARAANGALRSFRAVAGGSFSSDPAPLPSANAVPEPATWAMLLVGFAMVGLSARRRTRIAA